MCLYTEMLSFLTCKWDDPGCRTSMTVSPDACLAMLQFCSRSSSTLLLIHCRSGCFYSSDVDTFDKELGERSNFLLNDSKVPDTKVAMTILVSSPAKKIVYVSLCLTPSARPDHSSPGTFFVSHACNLFQPL